MDMQERRFDLAIGEALHKQACTAAIEQRAKLDTLIDQVETEIRHFKTLVGVTVDTEDLICYLTDLRSDLDYYLEKQEDL